MKKGSRAKRIALISFCVLFIAITIAIASLGIYASNFIDFLGDEALFTDAKSERKITFYYNNSDFEGEYEPALYDEIDATGKNRVWYSYDEISPYLINGFIAVEDRGYFSHHGFDIKRSARAALNYLFRGNKSFGGSTITQQVIKNISGDNEKTLRRKVDEVIRSSHLELNHSKEEIFELYLNVIPMSGNTTGVGMASELFFSKSPSEVNVAEAATLIAMANAPTRYNPQKNSDECVIKRNKVLYVMREEGVISEEEYQNAKNAPIEINQSESLASDVKSMFSLTAMDDAIRDVMKKYGYSYEAARLMLFKCGAKIYTTVDPMIQSALEEYFEKDENFPEEKRAGLVYSMVICDNDNNHLKGIISTNEYKNGSRMNYATTPIIPGSALKPIALYLPLVDRKEISWSSVFDDVPVSFSKNSDGSFAEYPKNSPSVYDGLTTVVDALRLSKNTVAVRLFKMLGAEGIYKYLTDNFRFDSLVYSKKTKSGTVTDLASSPLALGQLSVGVGLRKLTEAYTVFAAEGKMHKGRSYTAIYDKDGKTIIENREESRIVCQKESARLMTRMLMNVVDDGTASKINLKYHFDTAGKTGTSGGSRDKVFVGYTPYYTAGIWCGYAERDRAVLSSEKNHLSVWDELMYEIHELKLKYEDSERRFSTEGLSYEPFCLDSGERFSESCLGDLRGNRLSYGYFIKGTEPKENCSVHIQAPYNGIFPSERKISFILVEGRDFPKEISISDDIFVYNPCKRTKRKL